MLALIVISGFPHSCSKPQAGTPNATPRRRLLQCQKRRLAISRFDPIADCLSSASFLLLLLHLEYLNDSFSLRVLYGMNLATGSVTACPSRPARVAVRKTQISRLSLPLQSADTRRAPLDYQRFPISVGRRADPERFYVALTATGTADVSRRRGGHSTAHGVVAFG